MTSATLLSEAAEREATTSTRILLLVGPPGCGKGTQSRLITARFEIPAISTGDILRDAAASGNEIGRQVKETMESGGLVSDEVVNRIVAERICQDDCCAGFILDGYPRTIAQAEFLERTLRERNLPAPEVVVFDVDAELLIARLSSRRYCPCCGRIYNLVSAPPAEYEFCDHDGMPLMKRADDEESAIRQRLAAYDEQTAPLLQHYQQLRVHRVDASADPDTVAEELERKLTAGRAQPAL